MKYLSLKIFLFLLLFFFGFLFLFINQSFAYNYSDLTITGNAQYLYPSTYQINNILQSINCSTIKYVAIQQGVTNDQSTYYANLLNIYQGYGICEQTGTNSIRITNLSVIPPFGDNFFIVISTVPDGSSGYGTDFFSVTSITASPTPPPPPQSIALPVPLIKQYTLPWGIQTYDLANKWSPQNPTIARWGCALTSAAMVLQYYGIAKLPGGLDLDPGSLNTWLHFEKDGYIGDGLINWLALQRLSKQATTINNISTFDALQYRQTENEDIAGLISGLQNHNPGILEETTANGDVHFVVANGIENNSIQINDPFFNYDTLAGYNNHFLKLGQFVPVHSDLSYILLATDPEVTLTLQDMQGSTIATSYIQQPIDDDVAGGHANAKAETLVYSPTPEGGLYTISATSSDSKQHTLFAYVYDKGGNVNLLKDTISFSTTSRNEVGLLFNKVDSSLDTFSNPYSFIFSKIFLDLTENFWLGNVDQGSFESIKALLTDAQKEYLSGNIPVVETKLSNLETLLDAKRGKGILNSSYQVLRFDLQTLQASL